MVVASTLLLLHGTTWRNVVTAQRLYEFSLKLAICTAQKQIVGKKKKGINNEEVCEKEQFKVSHNYPAALDLTNVASFTTATFTNI